MGPRPGDSQKKSVTNTKSAFKKSNTKPNFKKNKPTPDKNSKQQQAQSTKKIDLLQLGGTEDDVKLLAGIDEEDAETLEFEGEEGNKSAVDLKAEMAKII